MTLDTGFLLTMLAVCAIALTQTKWWRDRRR